MEEAGDLMSEQSTHIQLSYDPSLVPAMVCGFAYGPVSGLTVGVLAVVIHALTTGDWVGGLMNIVAAIFFILPAALAYKKLHSFRGAVTGLILGIIFATAASIVSNLTIGVWFWYPSMDFIMPLIGPAIIPFNLIKTALNSVLTLDLVQRHFVFLRRQGPHALEHHARHC